MKGEEQLVYISFKFYIFVAIMVVIYYLIPIKWRWISLLCGNLTFYWFLSQFSKRRFGVLIALSLFSWIFGMLIDHYKQHKKVLLVLSIMGIAIPLVISKELKFIMEALVCKDMPSWWIVPIGFSFYTLQMIAYIIDTYQGKIKAEHNFFKYLLFISFFPQIVQGPIPRYSQLSKQLWKGNNFCENTFVQGFMLIIWGFFLKLCIADKAGIVVDKVFDNYPTYMGMYVLVAGVLYSFQLYADFLACTSLAQGVSALFGIKLVDNFRRPYFSKDIKDFWRRWHISLSSWLRDYIYIPLGGNRKGKLFKYLNVMITFAVSGIWHGGGYKYLFWGLLHGSYQVIGELLKPIRAIIIRRLGIDEKNEVFNMARTVVTFFLVMIGWIIFRADHLRTGMSMIKSIFTVLNPWILTNDSLYSLGLGWKEMHILAFCLIILLIVSWNQEKGINIRKIILNQNIIIRWCIYTMAILFVMIFGTYGYGYDAQSFIYGGF